MENKLSFDYLDEMQRNGIKIPRNDTSEDILNSDPSLNLTDDIKQQLYEFETILNNRRSELPFNVNDTSLEDINDIVSQHLFNEELSQNEVIEAENIDSNADLMSISINTISSTTDKEIDIISISSTDSQTSSSGYNSSDFEFITEMEARADGFIINSKGSNTKNDFEDPGEGPSGFNKKDSALPRLDRNAGPSKILNEYIDRSSNTLKYRKKPLCNYGDRNYRSNHEIPEGGDYLNLFQGIYDPMLQQIHILENKSFKTTVMNVEYYGIGFDKQLVRKTHLRDSSDDEFEDEAKENAKRILSMYPYENNKRRRRR